MISTETAAENSISLKQDPKYPAPICPEVPGYHSGKLSSVAIGGCFLYEGQEFCRVQLPASLGLAIGHHFGGAGSDLQMKSLQLERGFFAMHLKNSNVRIFTVDVVVPIRGEASTNSMGGLKITKPGE